MKRGFTLIEIMTAMSIFLIVMTMSMGSIVSVFDANRKSQSLRTVMGNLNLAVESMVKEMRFGKNYHCGTSLPLTSPQNCSDESFLSFLSSNDEQIVYRLNGTSIEKSVDSGSTYIPITAPEIIIEDLTFYTFGAGTAGQPKVFVKIRGYAGVGKARSDFTLQTLVSQRALDI